MALKEKITVDMQDAMRSKDSEKLNESGNSSPKLNKKKLMIVLK